MSLNSNKSSKERTKSSNRNNNYAMGSLAEEFETGEQDQCCSRQEVKTTAYENKLLLDLMCNLDKASDVARGISEISFVKEFEPRECDMMEPVHVLPLGLEPRHIRDYVIKVKI